MPGNHLFRDHGRLLSMGFALCFFSSYGQTFFIGVFGGALRAEFGLDDLQYGLGYSLATLVSGMVLLKYGRIVDTLDLRRCAQLVCIGLALSAVAMALSASWWQLGLALLGLRFFGQGLMGHVAITAVARYIHRRRAQAVSLTALGVGLGGMVWPPVGHGLMEVAGRMEIWLGLAVFLLLVMLPLLAWALRDHAARHDRHVAGLSSGQSDLAGQRQWTREEVLRDPAFYLLLPAALASPVLITGLFLHQVRIAELQGWDPGFFALMLTGFAVLQAACMLGSGPLIDRFGSRRSFPYALIPFVLALLCLAHLDGAWSCVPYLACLAVSGGATSTLSGTVWAEAYGVVHLGAIRSVTTAVMVLSTSGSPILFGWLLKRDWSVAGIAWLMIAYLCGCILLAGIVARRAAGTAPQGS